MTAGAKASSSKESQKEPPSKPVKKEEQRIEIKYGGEKKNDETCVTFLIRGEDHTIGNSLKEVVSRFPEVEFCGYNIPYPTEPEMLFRIQTRSGHKATDSFRKGLVQLRALFVNMQHKFEPEMLFRIQTRSGHKATDSFRKGLVQLRALFVNMQHKFEAGYAEWEASSSSKMESD